MKDKIISFILILIILAVIGALGILEYITYQEIIGDKEVVIDFQGIRKLIRNRKK